MLKPKKCKNCKQKFQPQRPLQYICSVPCAREYNQKLLQKQYNKERREWYSKNKTLSTLEKEARKIFQKWIRIRDKDLPCISCGALNAKQWDGGHFYKAELYSGLIFDEDNCHKQCSRCNDLYSGNELLFREGLIKRYGEDYVKDLEMIKDGLRDYEFSKQELIEIKNKYSQKIKQLT